jgi:hypothetical protein
MPSAVIYTPFLTPREFVAPIRVIATAAIRKTSAYCVSLLDSRMKRLAAWILVLVLVLPIGMSGLYLNWQKYKVRKAVKKVLLQETSLNNLTQLTFKKTEVNRLVSWKEDHEFSYNGQMYDIVSTATGTDSITYVCWPDDKESQLNKSLNRLMARALSRSTERQNNKAEVLNIYLKVFKENALMYIAPILSQFNLSHFIGHCKITLPYLDRLFRPPC